MDIQWDVSFFIARMVFTSFETECYEKEIDLGNGSFDCDLSFSDFAKLFFDFFNLLWFFLLKTVNPLANVVTFFVSKAG